MFSIFILFLNVNFVKLCSSNLNLIEIIFIRSLIATIILLPFIYILKIKIKTNLYSKHLFRTLIGVIAMFLNFYAVSKLPLSNYTIISFAKIFFLIPLAFLFLNEKIKTISFYISLGFIGVVLILGYEKNEKGTFPILCKCNFSNPANCIHKNIYKKYIKKRRKYKNSILFFT